MSEESRKKMSESHRGLTTWNKGKKMSLETRRKMSIARLGKSPVNKGVPCSEETKQKISESVKANPARYWLGKKMGSRSLEVRLKISQSTKGEKGNNWQGGITSINSIARHSLEYRLWRTAVFERDNYTCQECGVRSGNGKAVVLHAHHIKSFAWFPELRFAIDNGVTLCVPCHEKTNTYKGRSRVMKVQL